MEREAVSAGFYESEFYGPFPKIQLLTIEQLLAGQRLRYPHFNAATFKRAERKRREQGEQTDLF